MIIEPDADVLPTGRSLVMSEDGPWMDMSIYPETDPDAVLEPRELAALHDVLVVDDAPLPDDVWQQMLVVAAGEPAADPIDVSSGDRPDDESWTAADDVWSPPDDHADGHVPDHDLSDVHHEVLVVDVGDSHESDSW